MLSNKDFSKFLHTDKSSSNEKVRFDLNQVRTWDKQNEAQLNRKGKPRRHLRESHYDEDEDEDEDSGPSQEYRDRAKERRDDANPDYVEPMDVVAKLDVEQTKFLGGDIEHTYLVKGLDYALLQKARQQVQQAKEAAENTNSSTVKAHAVTTHTPLGDAMKHFLTKNAALSVAKPLSVPTKFCLLSYTYDLVGDQDIPAVIYHSKQDAHDADKMCVSVSSALMSSISTSVKNAAKHRSGVKKSDYYSNEEVKSFHAKPVPSKSFDIFEDVERFDPRAALESMVASRTANTVNTATAPSKYFESLAPETKSEPPINDLLAPVKQMIHKETMRTAQHTMVIEEGVKHRDIIGGTKGRGKGQGEALDVNKEYDASQFELNDYGGYSDDDDDGGGGFGGANAGKRGGGGGASGKKKGGRAGGPPSKKRK